jgi:thiamine biosynthesis protein ThiS
MPTLTINGDSCATPAATLPDLLEELGFPASLLLVEHNGKALHRSEWSAVLLAEGDRLELLQVAAGG